MFEGKDIDETLKLAYSPKSLNLNLATSKNIDKYEDASRELWISGPCIALHQEVWKEIKDKNEF